MNLLIELSVKQVKKIDLGDLAKRCEPALTVHTERRNFPGNKNGEPFGSPFNRSKFCLRALELITPGNIEIAPATTCAHTLQCMLMGAHATEVSRHVRGALDIGHRRRVGSPGDRLADIGGVIP